MVWNVHVNLQHGESWQGTNRLASNFKIRFDAIPYSIVVPVDGFVDY